MHFSFRLYNQSPVSKTVVTNDRWGIGTMCQHGDFYTCADRYNPGVLQPHKWENAMTLDKYSWGNRANARLEDFFTSKELIGGKSITTHLLISHWLRFLNFLGSELAKTISCGGNILINVGPTKTGLIDPIFVERLRDLGKWLGHNGDAIYGSLPWKYQNDTKTADVWYTSKVRSANRTTVYAIVLNYPYDASGVDLYALGNAFDNNTEATLLGFPKKLTVCALKIHCKLYFVSKISFLFHSNSGTAQRNRCMSNFQRKLKSINWNWNLRGRSKSIYPGSVDCPIERPKIECEREMIRLIDFKSSA